MRQQAFEVLVIGAGPAGLAASSSAASSGVRVGLIDDNPTAGGQIWRGGLEHAPTSQARLWFTRANTDTITLFARTRVISQVQPGVLLVETPSGAQELSSRQLILASGARELFLPFPGWTLPGVMGAGGLQALVKGGLPIAGKRVVVAGSGPLLIAVAAYLKGRGARVQCIVEQTSWSKLGRFGLQLARSFSKLRQARSLGWRLRGVPLHANSWITHADGSERLEAVSIQRGKRVETLPCDYLACGFGLVPNIELGSALGCAIEHGTLRVDEWQQTKLAGIYCAGEATGIGGLDLALLEGQIAGLVATGQTKAARALFSARTREQQFSRHLTGSFALRAELKRLAEPETLVCRCEDVSYQALQEHTNWRAAKLQTRCGMGPCQGRVCGSATAFLFGWTPDSVRPPVTVARVASLVYTHSDQEE
jgi:NADPH-dependent 2,4-dienoyl-CoA reductase/sulfur reductase-like enzyme